MSLPTPGACSGCALLRVLAAVLTPCRAAEQAPSSPLDGVPNMLTQVLKELKQMSDTTTEKLTGLEGKVDALTTELGSVKERLAVSDAAKDAALAEKAAALDAASSAKDTAVSALTAAQATIAELKAASQANTSDTSAIDAILDRMSAKVDADLATAQAIAPAAAVQQAGTDSVAGGASGTATVAGGAAAADPNAPQGQATDI